MLFKLGQLTATPGALAAVGTQDDLLQMIRAHVAGQWGVVGSEDAKANDDAVDTGGRILSAYMTPSGAKVWVITEADRSATCILLPEEY